VFLIKGLAFIKESWRRVNIAISDKGYIVKIWRSHYTNRYLFSQIDMIYDAKEYLIIPGLIDIHVHFREPGEEYKEDFVSGTKAALASGITIVGDMPNNLRPITTLESFEEKLHVVSKRAYTDFFLYAMLDEPEELSKIFEKFGHIPVKVYLYNKKTLEALIRRDLPSEPIYVFHAEHPDLIADHRKASDAYELNKLRPIKAELEGIDIAIKFAMRNRCHVHITHVTSPEAVAKIVEARRRGLKITCDVAPHHLIFFLEKINPKSPLYKVLPPIREKEVNHRLLRALARGLIDIIASDHAPHSPDEKSCSFSEAPPGIASIQFLLPLLYSISKRMHIDFDLLIKTVSENPARIFRVSKRGKIKVGYYADFAIFDPRYKGTIDPDTFFSKASLTPYNNFVVKGKVIATFLRGKLVYEDGIFLDKMGEYVGNIK